jgi:hypothetical protein
MKRNGPTKRVFAGPSTDWKRGADPVSHPPIADAALSPGLELLNWRADVYCELPLHGNGENLSILAARSIDRLRLAYDMPAVRPEVAYRSEDRSVPAQRAGAEDARKRVPHCA